MAAITRPRKMNLNPVLTTGIRNAISIHQISKIFYADTEKIKMGTEARQR
jgi:hypothetical protein